MSKIEIVKEGITELKTEAVVNAANEHLLEGGGVCGVIFQEAGPGPLQKACNDIGFCPTGSAVITPAFDLDARYIIHAVGPRWSGGRYGEKQLLYGAYTRSLELAREYGCKSIGFPLISAGIFGYPIDKAWDVAIHACNEFIGRNSDYDILIRFGVPSAENRRIGRKVLEQVTEDSPAD